MQTTPFILGRGLAGQAIAKSCAILAILEPDLSVAPAQFLPRDADLGEIARGHPGAVLAIANPHGLHAATLLRAHSAGFKAILCEKPACTDAADIAPLRQIETPVAIAHGYRQTWGMHALLGLVRSRELGELVAIEGEYWQGSGALPPDPQKAPRAAWKNEPRLSGPHDTVLDLATHWLDAACFVGGAASQIAARLSYQNAPAPHRDTHVQLQAELPKGVRAAATVSRIMHGAANDFELTALGTLGSATWRFMRPDELELGSGKSRRTIVRDDRSFGSTHPAYHALGWIEGYIEILRQLLGEALRGTRGNYPRLTENLDMLEKLFAGIQRHG